MQLVIFSSNINAFAKKVSKSIQYNCRIQKEYYFINDWALSKSESFNLLWREHGFLQKKILSILVIKLTKNWKDLLITNKTCLKKLFM